MFWLMRLRVFEPPMPPMPTVATLRVSLGAWKPRPSTWRGTIVRPAPVAATVVTNFRREMSVMIVPFRSLYSEGHSHVGPLAVKSPLNCGLRIGDCGFARLRTADRGLPIADCHADCRTLPHLCCPDGRTEP